MIGRLGADESYLGNIVLGSPGAQSNVSPLATDNPIISESVGRILSALRTTTENPTVSEVVTAGKFYAKTTTDSPSISEVITSLHVNNKTTTDNPIVSEVITSQKVLYKSISQSLTITQSNLAATPIQSVEQGLTISQSVGVESVLSKSTSNTLSFSQSADYFRFTPTEVSSTLTIAQNVDVVQTTGVGNILTITQNVAYQYDPHFEQGAQLLAPTQIVAVAAVFNRSISQTVSLIQSVTKLKIKSFQASNTLTILQSVLGGPLRRLSNTLVPTQTVVQQTYRNKSLHQTLAITQSVGLQLILNRSLTSTLVFKNEHPIPDGSGGIVEVPNLIYTKGGRTFECCPTSSLTTVFQSGSRTIVLPNPELNDAESLIAAVAIKRTITGDTYSYVKKSANRKLKYKFIINQRKAYELRRFLLDHLGDRITLNTFKGEIWSGYLLTDPAEITSNASGGVCTGDWYEINLEFQGVKVN